MAVRTRTLGGSVGGIVGSVLALIGAIIVLGILLVLIGVNEGNVIVSVILDIGRFFATPFHDLFPQDERAMDYLVNWGIAALVYFGLAGLVARFARW
ncbi:hypothetical protein [Allonocardiopsis opalescens]|uniref:Uncharacterized protein n=1 Tax=Allonocardiopsis opalescens TaxID=1144618 RepID=A0A2T0Q450_9ACTN|nr:hypothetical protein [Allonocardiopsis opalescens]PRX98578.1 hypothetical protein CLV72_104156 [Allonocardiopsis opalescens]